MDGDTVASPAEAWSPNELQSIARTDDFHMHPYGIGAHRPTPRSIEADDPKSATRL